MKALKLATLAVATLASSAAMANAFTDSGRTIFSTLTNPAAVSAEIGTLGYGASIGWSVNDTTEVQAGWSGGEVEVNSLPAAVTNQIPGLKDFNAKAKASNPYLGVQLRPAANWLTVGTGVIMPTNTVAFTIKPTNETITIGNEQLRAAELGNVTGDLKWENKLAPYVTVGFRPNLHSNWGVFGEVGAAYVGTPTVRLQTNLSDTARIISTSYPTVGQAVKAAENELNQKAADNAKLASWHPIAKVGATYRF